MDKLALLKEIEGIAFEAGEELRKLQPKAMVQTRKGPKDFATDADYLAESIIIPQIKELFPGIAVISEEAGGDIKTPDLKAVIDPLDGTINYFFQDHYWSISIGVFDDQEFRMGVIYAPRLEGLIVSSDGMRSFVQTDEIARQEITVSSRKDLAGARVWMDAGFNPESYQVLGRLAKVTAFPQLRCSAALCAIKVALGHNDGYYHPSPTPFDVAAAGIIVLAAHGTVTDRLGNPWHPFCGSFVATNGAIHDQLIELINSQD